MKRFITGVGLILLSLLLATELFAGTTGKLAGLVRDKDTGEPLVGANVVLVGTTYGAATDVDGYYVILNVPAGNYTVEINYIGYKTVRIENVRIVPDITKQLNVDMEATTLQGQVIEVVAEKPFFERTATNTISVIDADEIEKIPLKGISQMVGLSAGVVMTEGSGGETGNAALFVRGGRSNETKIIVDGIPYENNLFGNNSGTIPENSVEQVAAQLGGFSAKYGNAQSGVINIVTKSGSLTKYEGSFEANSSELTDPYDYNNFNMTLGGPLRFISKRLSFFTSYEYINAGDNNPNARPVDIPTAGILSDKKPNNESKLQRFTTKLALDYEKIKFALTMTGSYRTGHNYIHSYAKNNSEHNPKYRQDVTGLSFNMSHFLSDKFYYNFNAFYRVNEYEEGDGIFYDRLLAYGDSAKLAELGTPISSYGGIINYDDVGVFFDKGRVFDDYTHYTINTMGANLNFTYQTKRHLIEFGGSYQMDEVRYARVAVPRYLALGVYKNGYTFDQAMTTAFPEVFGYDFNLRENNSTKYVDYTLGQNTRTWEIPGPRKPVIMGLYFNDKIEFQNFVLNAGLRFDYFDPAGKRIRDLHDVFKYGASSTSLDLEDLEDMPVEMYVSPRIGFAFPITDKTVFHAQYGIFRQTPRYIDLYYNWADLQNLETGSQFVLNMGHLKMESTTQYEFGFNQQIGNNASLEITAFYKNVRGLTNIVAVNTKRANDTVMYMTPLNTDFGTIKGMTFGVDVRRVGPLSAHLDYTYSIAEGTGSSQSSSYVAAFRNPNGEIPKAIAPLSFDQRHTLTSTITLAAGKNEGPVLFGQKLLQNSSANFLITYNSGRPYTPVEIVNLQKDMTLQGKTTTYINSAYGSSNWRIDLRLTKDFPISKGVSGSIYLWVQNLFDVDNAISVYRSTGKADDTAFLNTIEGQGVAKAKGEEWVKDYKALERNPENWGIPRLVRLGFRVKF